MSLFQCQLCGCCENTALSMQGCDGYAVKFFSWVGFEDRKGKKLCSACAPTSFAEGSPSGLGQWHGEFDRLYLPMGMFFYQQSRQPGAQGNRFNEIQRLRFKGGCKMNIEQTNTITLTGAELNALKHALHTLQAPWKPVVVAVPHPSNYGDYTELQATAASIVLKIMKA